MLLVEIVFVGSIFFVDGFFVFVVVIVFDDGESVVCVFVRGMFIGLVDYDLWEFII